MARVGGWLSLAAAGLLASGCYMIRSPNDDRTDWVELPNDPRPELWAEGPPRLAVVLEGAYKARGDAAPLPDPQATEFYRRSLREARVFSEVLRPTDEGTERLPRLRLERRYWEDDHMAANMAKAATTAGLLSYRFTLTATLRLELETGEGPVRYEARSQLTRIYHHAGNRDRSRRILYFEADRANTEAVMHQLRADTKLFGAGAFAADTPAVSPPAQP
jgi:hypothetical protein